MKTEKQTSSQITRDPSVSPSADSGCPPELLNTAAQYCEKCGQWHVCGFNKHASPCMGHVKIRDKEGNQIGLRPCRNGRTGGTKVCRSHGAGGKATGGRPIIHGRYSKVLPTGLLEKFEDGLRDPELLSLRREIVLIDQALDGFLGDLELGEDDALILDQAHQFRLQSLIATRRSLVTEEWGAMQKAQQVLTIQQINVIIARLVDILKSNLRGILCPHCRKEIGEQVLLRPVLGEIRMLLSKKTVVVQGREEAVEP